MLLQSFFFSIYLLQPTTLGMRTLMVALRSKISTKTSQGPDDFPVYSLVAHLSFFPSCKTKIAMEVDNQKLFASK